MGQCNSTLNTLVLSLSAHVLLNYQMSWGDKMRGFSNEFNKFNNTRAPMLDSIYHMTLRLL